MSLPVAPNRARVASRSPIAPMLLAMGLALAGCASDPPKPPPPKPPPMTIELPGRHLVSVGEREADANIVLDAAQELRVRLPLDTFAVLGGRDWLLIDLPSGVLAGGPSKFERSPRDSNNEDMAGFVVWSFTPQSPGNVTLNFEKRVPQRRDAAEQSVTYHVRVK